MIISVDKERARRLIKLLILRFIKSEGRPITIKEYVLLPKLVVVEVGSYVRYKLLVYTFTKRLLRVRPVAVVFDVKGLEKHLATQVEIVDDGTVIVMPDRDQERVYEFIQVLEASLVNERE